jgi:hypothetical protein
MAGQSQLSGSADSRDIRKVSVLHSKDFDSIPFGLVGPSSGSPLPIRIAGSSFFAGSAELNATPQILNRDGDIREEVVSGITATMTHRQGNDRSSFFQSQEIFGGNWGASRDPRGEAENEVRLAFLEGVGYRACPPRSRPPR